MGWWSDVLADAIKRSGKLEIVSLLHALEKSARRSPRNTAARAAASYAGDARGPQRSRRSSTRRRTTSTSRRRAPRRRAGKHVFLDKPIANTIADARALTEACREAGVVLALGYQRRKESHFRWVREQIDDGVVRQARQRRSQHQPRPPRPVRSHLWRYTAEGMPGGVMLQIGIHYTDVLEYLIGPIKAVSGRLAQLVLPGDNPDVASMVLEHENGALSTLNASYASASEYYLMNVYGKEATAYYDLHQGLRLLKRGSRGRRPRVVSEKNDPIVEELEEFAAAVRGEGEPEMDGERATASLAVLLAGIKSAREGRRVEVAEMLASE